MNYEIVTTPQTIINIVLASCAAIVSISAAVTVIARAIGKAREPNKLQDERIAALEHQVEWINDRLQLGNKRFESDSGRVDALEQNMRETNKVIIESLQALTSHAIDGNNIAELKTAKKSLDEYLVSRM